MMLTYGLVIAAMLITFDGLNWIYFYLSNSFLNKDLKPIIGRGFFTGYLPIILSCIVIVIMFFVRDKMQIGLKLENITNLIIGTTFISQIMYIYFFRPRMILKGLSKEAQE